MKKMRIAYTIWLLLLAAVLIWFCVGNVPQTYFGKSRTLGIVLFVMVDLLCLIRLAEKGREGLRQLLVFIIVTIVYVYYCWLAKWQLRMNSYRDALVAGGLICAAVFLSAGKGLFKGDV